MPAFDTKLAYNGTEARLARSAARKSPRRMARKPVVVPQKKHSRWYSRFHSHCGAKRAIVSAGNANGAAATTAIADEIVSQAI